MKELLTKFRFPVARDFDFTLSFTLPTAGKIMHDNGAGQTLQARRPQACWHNKVLARLRVEPEKHMNLMRFIRHDWKWLGHATMEPTLENRIELLLVDLSESGPPEVRQGVSVSRSTYDARLDRLVDIFPIVWEDDIQAVPLPSIGDRLKGNTSAMTQTMHQLMQSKVDRIGAVIDTYGLTNIRSQCGAGNNYETMVRDVCDQTVIDVMNIVRDGEKPLADMILGSPFAPKALGRLRPLPGTELINEKSHPHQGSW